ncbi:MAG TPA: DUF4336 domain-containing protein [Rudaea sp.]|jgi:hypothetical protein|nr:DUF4336 domain-containing protein [Rudaea sp.]
MLEPFGPSLYVAAGPTVSFFGFPYPTRMAVARLSDGSAWVWSPVALTPDLAAAVQAIGPVRHIVSPNKLHHLFLQEWADHWPDARLYAPPGLARRKPGLHFHAELGDEPSAVWSADIDQAVFRGSFVMDEVMFFHRASRTAIVGDLIQRFPENDVSGWKRLLLKVGGLLGERGGTPIDWRTSFLRHGPARTARQKVLGWNPQRLLIAHGMCAQAGASEIIQAALSWM